MRAYVYILRCADGRYYVGSTRGSLERRVAEHNAGAFDGYTKWRRPVTLVFHEEFAKVTDAIAMERRLKGWTRAKKEALIGGDFEALKRLARRTRDEGGARHPSTRPLARAAQDEGGIVERPGAKRARVNRGMANRWLM